MSRTSLPALLASLALFACDDSAGPASSSSSLCAEVEAADALCPLQMHAVRVDDGDRCVGAVADDERCFVGDGCAVVCAFNPQCVCGSNHTFVAPSESCPRCVDGCGDGVCDAVWPESSQTCPEDCGPPVCQEYERCDDDVVAACDEGVRELRWTCAPSQRCASDTNDRGQSRAVCVAAATPEQTAPSTALDAPDAAVEVRSTALFADPPARIDCPFAGAVLGADGARGWPDACAVMAVSDDGSLLLRGTARPVWLGRDGALREATGAEVDDAAAPQMGRIRLSITASEPDATTRLPDGLRLQPLRHPRDPLLQGCAVQLVAPTLGLVASRCSTLVWRNGLSQLSLAVFDATTGALIVELALEPAAVTATHNGLLVVDTDRAYTLVTAGGDAVRVPVDDASPDTPLSIRATTAGPGRLLRIAEPGLVVFAAAGERMQRAWTVDWPAGATNFAAEFTPDGNVVVVLWQVSRDTYAALYDAQSGAQLYATALGDASVAEFNSPAALGAFNIAPNGRWAQAGDRIWGVAP